MAAWEEVDKDEFEVFLSEEESLSGILSAEVIEAGFIIYYHGEHYRDTAWVAKSQVIDGTKRYFITKKP